MKLITGIFSKTMILFLAITLSSDKPKPKKDPIEMLACIEKCKAKYEDCDKQKHKLLCQEQLKRCLNNC